MKERAARDGGIARSILSFSSFSFWLAFFIQSGTQPRGHTIIGELGITNGERERDREREGEREREAVVVVVGGGGGEGERERERDREAEAVVVVVVVVVVQGLSKI